MSEAPSARRRRIAGGAGLAAGALLLAFAGGVVDPSDWAVPSQSASFFPAVALAGAAACGIYIALAAPASAETADDGPAVSLAAIGVGLAAALYAIALPHLGLVASTLLLGLAVPVLLGYRTWSRIAVFLILIIGLSWFVFIRLLNVPLPL